MTLPTNVPTMNQTNKININSIEKGKVPCGCTIIFDSPGIISRADRVSEDGARRIRHNQAFGIVMVPTYKQVVLAAVKKTHTLPLITPPLTQYGQFFQNILVLSYHLLAIQCRNYQHNLPILSDRGALIL
jgi:hypothetical protein